jgi:hypothetical protein
MTKSNRCVRSVMDERTVAIVSDQRSAATASEPTYWNGERTSARKVSVSVADDPRFPEYWARDLVEQRRDTSCPLCGSEVLIRYPPSLDKLLATAGVFVVSVIQQGG